jgi:quercetin dioxygenase-like cupin family protein
MLWGMAIPHAQPGQPIEANGFPEPIDAVQSTALFKSRDLEVIRLILAAGKSLPPHKVAGDITIHCLSGLIEVGYGDFRPQLLAGQMVFLPGGAVHDVKALSDARALVTIALRPVAKPPAA